MIPALPSCHLILLFAAVSGLQFGKIITYPYVQLSESGSHIGLSEARAFGSGQKLLFLKYKKT
jgi:hypothetical protein